MENKNYFERNFEYENSSLKFTYKGISSKDVDKDKIYKIIDNCFMNRDYSDSINLFIKYLKIIFRDFTESIILIESINPIDGKTQIFIKDNEIKEFKRISNLLSEEIIVGSYNEEDGYNFSVKKDFKNNPLLIEIVKSITKFTENCLYDIQNIEITLDKSKFDLSNAAVILSKIYKTFYEENPDFSLFEDELKAQSLMFILYQFNMSIDKNEKFDNATTLKIPYSSIVQGIIDEMLPYGKIKNDEIEDIKLDPKFTYILNHIKEFMKLFNMNFDKKTMTEIGSLYYVYTRVYPGMYSEEIFEYFDPEGGEFSFKKDKKLIKCLCFIELLEKYKEALIFKNNEDDEVDKLIKNFNSSVKKLELKNDNDIK